VTTQSSTRTAIYYGWWILAAGAVMEMLALGSTSYAAGLFVLPLEEELGLSRAAANSSILISFAGAMITGPLVGYLLDRYPINRVLILGAVVFAVGFLAIAATSSIPVMVLALFFPVAFGGMAIGQLTTTTLVSRWFYKQRGRALGMAAVATSFGGIVVAPILSEGIDAFGWRIALGIEAVVIALIITVLAIFVIRSGPSDLGLEGHSENEGRPAVDIPAAHHAASVEVVARLWAYPAILASLNFWAITVVLSVLVGISAALIVTAPAYVVTLGFEQGAGSRLVLLFAVAATIVKLASGWMSEFFDRRLIMLGAAFAMLAALGVLAATESVSMLILAYCLAGAAQGGVLPTSSALIASYFGAPSFGRVLGASYVAVMLLCGVAALFMGAMYDRFGGYELAFMILLGASVVAAAAALFINVPHVAPRQIQAA
jgi:MFS family permease